MSPTTSDDEHRASDAHCPPPRKHSAREAKKKRFERFFLDKMIEQLGWKPTRVEDSESPDFFLDLDGRRCAVEVTQILQGEVAGMGSPVRAQEVADDHVVDELRNAYFGGESPQSIAVSVILPLLVRSPAVRELSQQERRAHMDDLKQAGLAELQRLPKLAPGESRRLRVDHRRGGATLHVHCLPPDMGAERLWDSVNNHVGWVVTVRSELLQSKIAVKAAKLEKYRGAVDAAFLLVVADRGRASGFFELDPKLDVKSLGFDAVYFQDDQTRLVASG